MSAPTSPCPRCGKPPPATSLAGNCPHCLFGSALEDSVVDAPETSFEEPIPVDMGDYEIVAEIGRGGTGVVYQARQRSLQRVVALKTLQGAALNSRQAFERLQIEAQAVARLDHPNIVPLYEVGRHAGVHFLTLRFFPQGSLADALKQRRFTAKESAQMASAIAKAVHYAHARGVLHRDLKPSNFLLDEAGNPHIADFGLAKIADSENNMTLSTSVLGTPAYMAPEQAEGNTKAAGTAADIYSIGAVLFELLTGRAPFVGKSALEVLRKVADDIPTPPRSLNPLVDRDLEAVCLRCLEKDPNRRYSSAAALAEDLDRWLRQEPLTIRPLSYSERTLRWVRTRPLIAALSAFSVLALVSGLLGVGWQWQRVRVAAEEARRNTYLAEINLANRSAESGDWPTVRSILERTKPAPGRSDLRGWEWRYLWGVSRSDVAASFGKTEREIASIALLQDGKTLAIGEFRGGFTLWDIVSGRQLYALEDTVNDGNFGGMYPLNQISAQLAAIPDSTMLAYTDNRSAERAFIELWDILTRTIQRSIRVPACVRHLAVSPNGRYIACTTLTHENRVLLYKTQTGELVRSIPARFNPVAKGRPLAFSPDSSAIAFENSAEDSDMRVAQIVDIETGATRLRLPQDQTALINLAFSPDNRWIATSDGPERPQVHIWDLKTGVRVHRRNIHGQGSLNFTPDGSRLFVGFDVLRLPDFELERRLEGESSDMVDGGIQFPGDVYLTASRHEIHTWDLKTRPRPRQGVVLPVRGTGGDFLPGGNGVIFVSSNRVFRSSPPHFDLIPLEKLGTDAYVVRALGDESRLLVSRTNGTMTIHDTLNDFRELQRMHHGITNFMTAFYLPRLREVVLVSHREGNVELQVWNMDTARKTWETNSATYYFRFACTPSSESLYQVFHSGKVVRFDIAKRTKRQFDLQHGRITGFAYGPGEREFLVTDFSGTKFVVDSNTLKTIRRLENLDFSGAGVDIWPDGSRWVFANGNVVDPLSGRLLLSLQADFGTSHDPMVSRDGHQVIAFTESQRHPHVCVWRAPTWEEIDAAESTQAR